MKKRSLRFRLCFYFTVFLILTWLVAALFSWLECREYINEFFDTQQIQYAKTLSLADMDKLQIDEIRLPSIKEILPGVNKETRGTEEDDALSFAIFSADGKLLLANGSKGARFIFKRFARGFSEELTSDHKDLWRILIR